MELVCIHYTAHFLFENIHYEFEIICYIIEAPCMAVASRSLEMPLFSMP